ncbi:MAG TPA: patatin-like phospholipase family protein [Candidatus Acidoferrales bacterium]|nr:patatin-like phospholipase family protein [Candidatus Acidoferrales bacterium]
MPISLPKARSAAALAELDALRDEFRATIATTRRPAAFASRVGVVLSGGGARGAYEAGVLMAFQDAQVPTHIIAATSVGSINAASFAAQAEGLVGQAEPLIAAWLDLTPATLGIDWSRYIFLLAGLVAASAGIGNFLWLWLQEHGIFLHAHHPKITWLALGVAGISILLFADKLSYIGYVGLKYLRKRDWEPDWRKTWVSFGANVLVWGFIVLFLSFTYIHLPLDGNGSYRMTPHVPMIFAILIALGLYRLLQDPLSKLSHRFLRMPLRTGLFPNFDRIKFLRARIPDGKLRNSAIRVIMTATDIQRGAARFFSNATVETLVNDPGAHEEFIRREVESPQDLVLAAVASSAYTFAYEAVTMDGRLWTDGGIMTNQPVLPALRLGADVLFLVLIAPLEGAGANQTEAIKTFLDVGVHAVDILISKNFKSDIAMLSSINRLCTVYAAELGVKPEQLELEIGKQHYRFVKFFDIAPQKPLPADALDFDSEIVSPIIVQGYRDARSVIQHFLEYEASRPASDSRRIVRLAAERPEGNFHMTGR